MQPASRKRDVIERDMMGRDVMERDMIKRAVDFEHPHHHVPSYHVPPYHVPKHHVPLLKYGAMPSFPNTLASKLPNVGTTIFTVMSRLAQEHNAINLSQGFPDFDCAPRLRDLVTKYINAGLNQYPPMAGVVALREQVAAKIESLYGARYDVEHEVTVVPGATYGIFTAIATLVRPGDEVILIEPAYDSYAPSVEVAGGVPVYVQLRYPDYSIDWQQVGRAITPKTRAIVINTPNNPTASVFSGEDLRMLEGLLRGTNVVVISDEVYEHIVFDGHRHQSVASFPGLAERSYVVSSFGKTYHV